MTGGNMAQSIYYIIDLLNPGKNRIYILYINLPKMSKLIYIYISKSKCLPGNLDECCSSRFFISNLSCSLDARSRPYY